jgi:hypothetical protein
MQQAMGYGRQAFAGTGAQAAAGGAAMLSGAGGIIGRVGLAGLGFTGYQLLSQSLQTFETRSRGVLAVGSLLDEQYGEIDRSLKGLRQEYHVLAQEGTAAMMTLGRATGRLAGVGEAIRVGRAYGIEPVAAAGLQTQFTMLGREAIPNLAELVAVRNQAAARGQTRLPFGRFAEEVATIAETGGLGAAPLDLQQYGRFAALMGTFGPRAAAHPGQAYAEFAAGLAQPAGTMGQVLRHRAISELAQRQPTIMLGNRPLNIAGSWIDRQIAMENAYQLAPVQQAYQELGGRLGGGNRDLQTFYYGQLFQPRTTLQAREQAEALAGVGGQPGGIPGFLQERAPVVEANREITRRLEQQRLDEAAREGYELRRREAEKQVAAETELIKSINNIGTQVISALGASAKAYQENEGIVRSLNDGLKELSPTLLSVVGGLGVILGAATFNPALLGLGAAAGLGAFGAERLQTAPPPGSLPDASTRQPRKAQ